MFPKQIWWSDIFQSSSTTEFEAPVHQFWVEQWWPGDIFIVIYCQSVKSFVKVIAFLKQIHNSPTSIISMRMVRNHHYLADGGGWVENFSHFLIVWMLVVHLYCSLWLDFFASPQIPLLGRGYVHKAKSPNLQMADCRHFLTRFEFLQLSPKWRDS